MSQQAWEWAKEQRELHSRSGLVADLANGADAGRLGLAWRLASAGRGPSGGAPGMVAEKTPRRARLWDWIRCGWRPVSLLCQTLRPSSTLMSVLLDWCQDAALNYGTVNATVTSTVVCLDRSAAVLGPRRLGDKIVFMFEGRAVSAG
ncbi:hypothetical protein NDU88_004801 [Pleurodeles waltl]|uniref:Uncharacterized protein n=1 Tax=Pleurodeles waltl TaxID=8319 RepID=A0AAV7LMK2_PLEWA|nr:hypothetical protein NDU88_004801 [Pleurodeles waltl]